MIHNSCIKNFKKKIQIIMLLCLVASSPKIIPLWLVLIWQRHYITVMPLQTLGFQIKRNIGGICSSPKVVRRRVWSHPGVRMNRDSVIATCPWSGNPGSIKVNWLMWDQSVRRLGWSKGYFISVIVGSEAQDGWFLHQQKQRPKSKDGWGECIWA